MRPSIRAVVNVCCCHTVEPGDSFGLLDVLGFGAFAFGFVFEVVADAQKSAFRAEPENKDKFITTGTYVEGSRLVGALTLSLIL